MDRNFEMILKYLRGGATLDERLEVMAWIKESEENRKEMLAFRRIFDTLLVSDVRAAEKNIAGRGKKGRVGKVFARLGSAAVAAAVAAGVFFMARHWQETPDGQALNVAAICAPVGRQTMTVLSDGTQVRLNSGSRLEIMASDRNERRVRLDGEAYFEVARDEQHPFVLETASGMEVKVLGTAFNVNAYGGVQSVVLVEGRVEAKGAGETESTVMEPSQRFVYNSADGTTVLEDVDAEEYISWTEGYLLLKDDSVPEILGRIGHYYGVEITCSHDEFTGVEVSGKLVLDGGVETALKTLSMLVPMTYDTVGDARIRVLRQ